MVPVFKDGDSLDVGRYRPITLLVVLAKAVESVIKALVERNQQKTLHPSIMGFTKGRGRELAIFNLVETILHRQFENRDGPAKHQRTYMLVSDEADAFDGMDRKAAEIALYEMGVRGKWWLLESNMTASQEVRVVVHGQLSAPYKRSGGAAQGAVLTPTKYSAVKSYLQERLERMGLGVMVGDRCVTGVSYADDGAALEESAQTMTWVLEQYERESRELGNRYREKDQSMIVFGPSPNRKRAWKLGSIKVQEKRQTMFLGKLMAANKIQGTRSQIKSVVDRANRAQVMLTWAGCYEDNRSLSLLRTLYESLIESILIAGLTTIQMTEIGRDGASRARYE